MKCTNYKTKDKKGMVNKVYWWKNKKLTKNCGQKNLDYCFLKYLNSAIVWRRHNHLVIQATHLLKSSFLIPFDQPKYKLYTFRNMWWIGTFSLHDYLTSWEFVAKASRPTPILAAHQLNIRKCFKIFLVRQLILYIYTKLDSGHIFGTFFVATSYFIVAWFL